MSFASRSILTVILAAVLLCVAAMPPSTVTAQETPTAAVNFSVSGTVSSGTAGTTLPANLTLTLNLVTPDSSGALKVQTQTAPLASDSTYHFENVTAAVGSSVFVTVNYLGATQGSLIAQLQAGQTSLDLPITLYAPTSEPSVVTLLRAQYILDFLPGNLMQVLATYYYSVSGDRFFISRDRDAQGEPISVQIPLPVGAQSIAFTNNVNNRYAVGGDAIAPVILDSRPILPQQSHELVFSYQIPYDKGAPIDQDYPFATQMIEVLIPNDAGVKLTGDFNANPNLTINAQRPYTQYNLKAPLAAGSRLIYTLDGIPPVQVATPARAGTRVIPETNFVPLILALIVLIVVIALIATSLLRPRRKQS
ncbi:MAG: hypothetical protein KF726_13315 [Anaerolineae bacterium]|nr:hypothetical protein [Anaerolineae bacterium]